MMILTNIFSTHHVTTKTHPIEFLNNDKILSPSLKSVPGKNNDKKNPSNMQTYREDHIDQLIMNNK